MVSQKSIIGRPSLIKFTLNVAYVWLEGVDRQSHVINALQTLIIGAHSHELGRAWGEGLQGRGTQLRTVETMKDAFLFFDFTTSLQYIRNPSWSQN